MSMSILSEYYECLICGRTLGLHKHHVFEGTGRRALSEKYGCWCYLCPRHHNASEVGVHFNKQLDLKLKKKCQKILEDEKGWSRERFITVFGRNYRMGKEDNNEL